MFVQVGAGNMESFKSLTPTAVLAKYADQFDQDAQALLMEKAKNLQV